MTLPARSHPAIVALINAGAGSAEGPCRVPCQVHQLAAGQVVRPYAYGQFRRPEPVPGLPDEGDIWVCKLGWWTGAPWDVLAYARQHPSYPCDSTLEQLYDASEFEAYHQLGAAAVQDAAENCQPPLGADVLTKVN